MIKLLLTTLIIGTLFTGCKYETDIRYRAQQEVACKAHNGVYSYTNIHSLVCNDGTIISLDEWLTIKGPEVATIVIRETNKTVVKGN